MLEVLSMPFMQRALIAALLTGLLAPTIGTYIVQRRLSLLGDGLGHVAIAGVGLAFITAQAPVPVAVVVCVLGGLVVETLRQRGQATGDLGLAILFYGGIATGVLLAGAAGAGTGTLSQYLFGSLTTVTVPDLVLIVVLGVIVMVPAFGLAPQLFAVCSDEEFARVLGVPVRFYNYLIVVLAALTVALAMRTVGLLLVSALMVVPVAAAQNLVRGFYATLAAAMLVGATAAVGGATGSYFLDLSPGALIVVVTIAVFGVSWPIGQLLRRRRTVPEVPDEGATDHERVDEHPHRHSADCEHPAIRHGAHVDYLHDGHLHAHHGDHYDEH